ncbi:MAG: cupin domain-containing protein [Clostridiales bacterium]|jgi:uncharacterized cupin superfamily protein|nr:cupin domain-containing protein [Clostridiales bacterium]
MAESRRITNKKIKISGMTDIEPQSGGGGNAYQYDRYKFIGGEDGFKVNIAFLRIPPKKAALPLHYHGYAEKTFYIISGTGEPVSVGGEYEVRSGDIVFFPTGIGGAHKLIDGSDKEGLVYVDFDAYAPLDITYYPGKDKIGIFGENYTGVLRMSGKVGLYEDE